MFLDYSVGKNCYNCIDSYGEICVGCNCCGRLDKNTKQQARIDVNKRHLSEWAEKLLDEDFQTEIQQTNILENMAYFIKEIKKAKRLNPAGGSLRDEI